MASILGLAEHQKKRRISLTMNGKSDQLSDLRLRLSLRQLEVFVATARAGTTRAAADRVARSQSAASSALADLEEVLGVELFDRVGRRLLLNENGRALLPRAQELLEQANGIESLFSSADQTGPLRIAASFTIGEHLLPRLVTGWTRAHARSPIRLHIANSHEVIEAVAAFDADAGFIEGPETHPDIAVHPWLTDELVIVAAPDRPDAGRVLTARELSHATWVLREQGSGTRQTTDAWLTRHLREVRVGIELGSTEAIKQVVASGFGLGCLSRHAVQQSLADGRLSEVRCRLPKGLRALSAITRRGRKPGRASRAFLEHCGVRIARST